MSPAAMKTLVKTIVSPQASTKRSGVAKKVADYPETIPLLRTTDALPLLVSYVDVSQHYRFANKTYERWFRKPREKFLGKPVKEVLGRSAYKALLPYFKKALRGEVVHYQGFVPFQEGGTRFISGTYIPDRSADGSIQGFIAIIQDITAQQNAERALRFLAEASAVLVSSLNYRATLKSVAHLAVPHIADWCVVTIKEEDGSIQQLAVAHKDPKKVTLALHVQRQYPPDPKAKTGVPHVIRTGRAEMMTEIPDEVLVAAAKDAQHLKLIRKLGLKSYMIVPLKIGRRVLGAITFIAAESGRLYQKQDLLTAQELASRAALAIENARLYTSAKEALQSREMFLSIASHELKTPVTSMKVYAQILQKLFAQKQDKQAIRYLEKINDQINKQIKLINDLLNFSRIRVGKFVFESDNFNLQQLITETIESIQATTHHRIIYKGEAPTKIRGDKDRIGQVLINLLTNAIKYSPEAKKIIVTARTTTREVIVVVHDFGIGISSANQKKIFNRFYQVDSSKNKTYPGLGIGLYISAEIVRRHGGKIVVKSTKGKGSLFAFNLPRQRHKQ